MKNTIHTTNTKAFSMLELVFVIVILGIVSSIGASVIAKVYESYIIQRAVHRASIKTELAINQLANRLTYRINGSVLAKDKNGANAIALRDITSTTANFADYRILEWIGYENDGFSAKNAPGWSGFADLGHANTKFESIETTGSDLLFERNLLGNLFPGSTPAILFMTNNYKDNTAAGGIGKIPYAPLCMYRGDNTGCIFPVHLLAGNTTLTFTGVSDRVSPEMIYNEFYQLAASAYAVVPDTAPHKVIVGGTDVWDLHLHANYQPWSGDTYLNGTKSLLLKNVSVFRFTQETNSVRIKLCVIEAVGDTEISICKEKAVIR